VWQSDATKPFTDGILRGCRRSDRPSNRFPNYFADRLGDTNAEPWPDADTPAHPIPAAPPG